VAFSEGERHSELVIVLSRLRVRGSLLVETPSFGRSLGLLTPVEADMADYATLLRDHVTLTCRSVDRIFLQAYVPKLQTVGWVCQFLNRQRGFAIPSSAAFGKIGAAYSDEVHRWAAAHGVPVLRFGKGDNKEQIARPLLDVAAAEGGDGRVVLVGVAQEKAPVWRSWKAKGQEHAAHPHMEWGR
jgi:hypothetical protein